MVIASVSSRFEPGLVVGEKSEGSERALSRVRTMAIVRMAGYLFACLADDAHYNDEWPAAERAAARRRRCCRAGTVPPQSACARDAQAAVPALDEDCAGQVVHAHVAGRAGGIHLLCGGWARLEQMLAIDVAEVYVFFLGCFLLL
jgi:hypothetical protein